MAESALDAVSAQLRPGVHASALVEAAEVIEDAGFTTVDDLVHGFGGGYLPPVIGSRSRAIRPTPDVTLEAGMTVVVQPNVATADGRLGVQTGELLLVTDQGRRTPAQLPERTGASRMNTADVVVIGAGPNSLIGAAYLAAAGLEVVVLEEQPHVGGNTVTEELTLPGFRHDSCSSAHVLIQTNPVIRDDELGLAKHGLRYVHTDPAVVLPLADGRRHRHVSATRSQTAAERARFDPADGEAYLRLLADWESGRRRRTRGGTRNPYIGVLRRRRGIRGAAHAQRARGDCRAVQSRAGARPADLAVLRDDHRRPARGHRHPAVLDHLRPGSTSAGPRRSAAPARCPRRWCARSRPTVAGCASAGRSSGSWCVRPCGRRGHGRRRALGGPARGALLGAPHPAGRDARRGGGRR